MMSRAGTYRTNLSGEASYQSFIPSPLPLNPAVDMNDEIIRLLVQTNSAVNFLEQVSSIIPNMDLFVSMYVRKEALMSSQIEGTQATLEDVLDAGLKTNVNQNVADVINHIKATDYAIKRLEDLPLCNRLIQETHGVLMQNTRGQERLLGILDILKTELEIRAVF